MWEKGKVKGEKKGGGVERGRRKERGWGEKEGERLVVGRGKVDGGIVGS